MPEPDSGGSPGAEITERTARAHLERRIQHLESELARATESRDAVRQEAAFFRQRLAKLGRMVQILILVRGAVRHPRRLPQLPGRLRAVIASRGVPAVPESGEETLEPSPRELAAERRAAVGHAVRDRSVRQARDRPLGELRVAIVADDELVANLAPDCDLVALRPDDWRRRLSEQPPDLLLVESAWRGPGGSWQYRVAWHGHPDALEQSDLRALVAWSRERDIPTVFWHTAAPHLFGRFRQAAALFDHIAAVDEEAAGAYEAAEERTAASVSVARHAVQPRRHNPAGSPEAEAGPAYVGTWDPTLPLRRRDLVEDLLDAGLPHGLRIYDQSRGAEPGVFAFPDRFRPAVARRLAAHEVPAAYRRHPLVLDAADGGEGGLPRRMLEALACGTPAVAAGSASVPRLFDDLVRQAGDRASLAAAMADALGDAELRRRARLEGPAAVYLADTYAHRLASMASAVGYRVGVLAPRMALLILDTDGPAAVDWDAGSAAALQITEVLVGATDWEAGRRLQSSLAARMDGLPVRLVEQQPGDGRGQRLRRLAAAAEPGWLAIMGTRVPGAPVLRALSSALAYVDADVVSHDSPENGMLAQRDVVLERGWPSGADDTRNPLARWSADGVRVHAVGADARAGA